jgi:hypothetical protein
MSKYIKEEWDKARTDNEFAVIPISELPNDCPVIVVNEFPNKSFAEFHLAERVLVPKYLVQKPQSK